MKDEQARGADLSAQSGLHGHKLELKSAENWMSVLFICFHFACTTTHIQNASKKDGKKGA